jgi:hypothetical protein
VTAPEGPVLERPLLESRRLHWLAKAALLGAIVRVLTAGHERWYDTAEYIRGARALVGEGSYEPVRYPPGFPALLATAKGSGLPYWSVATASGVVLVVLIWWAAVKMAGPVAGVAAAVGCASSGMLAESGVILMADTTAAAFTIAAVLAAMHDRWTLAGVMIGASTWIRLAHASFLVALWKRPWALVVGAATLVPLAAFNLAVYGSLSGYESGEAGWVLVAFTDGIALDTRPADDPNWVYYLSVLAGRWGYVLPGVPVLAAIELWRRRTDRVTQMAVTVIALNLTCYAFYYFQSARFILPTVAILAIYASAAAARLVSHLLRRWSPDQERHVSPTDRVEPRSVQRDGGGTHALGRIQVQRTEDRGGDGP